LTMGRCKVLVVEDDVGIREMLIEVLEMEGYEIRSSKHGLDALTVLERWSPHVILLDLNMPVMDGWAFRAEQRRRHSIANIPVIVLSASRATRTDIQGLSAADFLPKPCNIRELISTVERLVSA
jgi:DNA-binding response OmpR family regulator